MFAHKPSGDDYRCVLGRWPQPRRHKYRKVSLFTPVYGCVVRLFMHASARPARCRKAYTAIGAAARWLCAPDPVGCAVLDHLTVWQKRSGQRRRMATFGPRCVHDAGRRCHRDRHSPAVRVLAISDVVAVRLIRPCPQRSQNQRFCSA